MKKVKHRDKRLSVMLALCAVSLIGMVLALTREQKPVTVDFVPPIFESQAVAGTPEVPSDLGWQELDAKAFRFGVCGAATLTGDEAGIYLTNPDSNDVWLKARILDASGAVLGETGLIRPGEYVVSVKLNSVPENGAAIGIKVMAYQPDTYFSEGSATLNTIVKVGA